ncbi:sialate O-acetylesterase [Horticoccus sp. 23ND18S-11]|uniref:sialate O-acetylesterase n=1 Tax=Horticoccus sp. 23ND18S-11 TaxID=3391832 RepID=UPI0039C9CFD5
MITPRCFLPVLALAVAPLLRAELKLPAIIGDHMVLQQKQANPIWGWDTPGTKVTVAFAGQTHTATAGSDGRWTVKLQAVAATAKPQTITINASSKREIQDVLVGEVWMCSGQSNMQWSLGQTYTGDLEGAGANRPTLRIVSVPQVGTQELKTDFKGQWEVANPENAKAFSAIGYLYGRYLHDILNVPVGLIDNAWGGSAAEAWIRRETIEKDSRFAALMESTRKRETDMQSAKGKADFEAAQAKWKVDSEKAKAAKKAGPNPPTNWLTGNARPGNIFAGVVHPTLGYGIKGVIWYQGESNAGRAYEHATLFPFLIEQWRKEQGQGDFPFYWVQLADYRPEKPEPGESDWAELRETQTKTLALPNTGQAVIIDIGEGRDIHPRNKYDVASRLVRWALVKDYGMKFPYRSPEYKSVAIAGNTATVTIDCFGSTLRTFDVTEAKGFAVCGADRVWHWATGKVIAPDKVEVSSDQVAAPVAVRYAWADNPVCNLFSSDGLPVTPFRTDTFDMTTKPKPVAAK